MAIISAVGTASQISASNTAADAEQDAALDQQIAMNAQRIQEMEEVNRKAALELTEEKRESLREQASARVASAESGAVGGVALRNLANVYMQDAIDSGTIISMAESDIVQIGTQSQADFLQTRSRINTAQSKKSSGLSSILQIGTSAAGGYGSAGGFSSGTAAIGSTPAVSNWSANKTAFKNTWT
jgi:hypothetical protein